MPLKPKAPKQVATLKHKEAKRANIPTAEYHSVMEKEDKAPKKVSYPRGGAVLEQEKAARNTDLDPQLIWRGKDQQDWSDLVVNPPPLYIQEKVKPKVLIDDLRRRSVATEIKRSLISSANSTVSPKTPTRPTSTTTMATGRTA